MKTAEYNREAVRKFRMEHPDRWKEIKNRSRIKTQKHINAYFYKRLATLPDVKLVHSLRSRMRDALRRNSKATTTVKFLGCSIEDFWIYLESKFEPGMSRENLGKVWHIDHIVPCALFDLSNPEHQRRCFHFSNLQPLFALENQRKGKTTT